MSNQPTTSFSIDGRTNSASVAIPNLERRLGTFPYVESVRQDRSPHASGPLYRDPYSQRSRTDTDLLQSCRVGLLRSRRLERHLPQSARRGPRSTLYAPLNVS